jgi:two-component system, chemotaxis family, CheB/CheR fusion protein
MSMHKAPGTQAVTKKLPKPQISTKPPPKPFPVVGIGASAGGLEAFRNLLTHVPTDTGMGFVLVQHLDPGHDSALTELLGRATSLPVSQVRDKTRVEPNHIYVIPPNTNMAIEQGVLRLQPRPAGGAPHHSIDYFFESLAHDQHECAVGVVLSGTASDGTLGLEAIKAESGITFAQDDSAKFDSMPRSAIAAGCVDFVLPPEGIARELARIARHPYVLGESELCLDKARVPAEKPRVPSGHKDEEQGLKKILSALRSRSGVDFSLYKEKTIQRRIARRIMLSKLDNTEAYFNFLRAQPSEFEALYSDLLINVTGFFRDPGAFAVLSEKVFPKLSQQPRDEPIRLWVAGCSTGQEAYSLAIALVEHFEQTGQSRKLQIFATDVNEALLEKARVGLYTKAVLQDLSQERLRRFFVQEDGGYRVGKFLREMAIFARHNLLTDPPFSRMDFVTCRNVLIYLEADLQRKILPLFHYALKPQGCLFLGQSEALGLLADFFETVDKKYKIFLKKTGVSAPMQFAAVRPSQHREVPAAKPEAIDQTFGAPVNIQREADRLTLKRFAPTSVLLNSQLHVVQFRGETSPYLKPPHGNATFHLLKMAREGLVLPLRAAINKSKKDNQPVRKEGVRLVHDDGGRKVNLEVVPLTHLQEQSWLVFFEDAIETRHKRLTTAEPPRPSPQSLSRRRESLRVAQLEQELAETRDYLQSIQEQAEASSEELQSSNEEVTSANEELQSINEELETSKEELESANEELTTVNDEMATRNAELNRSNADLNNLHASVNVAILLLTRELTIRRFTSLAQKIFNLTATDIGRPLNNIRHNLQLSDLEPWLNEAIQTGRELERETRDQQGRWYSLRIRPYLTLDNKIDGAVLVLHDIDTIKRSAEEVAVAREHAEAILRTTRDPLVVLGPDLRVSAANAAFYKTFRANSEQTVGRLLYELGKGQWNIPKLRECLEDVLARNSVFNEFEVTDDFENIGRRTMVLNARRLETTRPDVSRSILLAMDDITESRQLEAVRLSEVRYRRLFEAAKDGVLIVEPADLHITDANQFMSELLGYTREEMLGKDPCDIGLFGDREQCEAAFRELRQKKLFRTDDAQGRRKNGDRVDLELVSNLYEEDGRQVIQCNVRDITDRKQTHKALSQAKDKLARQAEELERTVNERTAHLRNAIGELEAFSYSISHDMRAPLRAMVGYATLALHEARNKLNPTVQEHMSRIIAAGNRLDRLIQDVLSYSRVMKDSIRLDALDLEAVIQAVIEQYSGLQSQQVDLHIERPLLPVLGHEAALTQCVANLLSNAIKFVPPGRVPRLRIWTEKRPPANPAPNHGGDSLESDSRVRIWFEDNGIGIPQSDLHRIFGMFVRVHALQEYEGTGIGLAIVRKAVERMGGEVGVESRLGQGSRFWFELKSPS